MLNFGDKEIIEKTAQNNPASLPSTRPYTCRREENPSKKGQVLT
jgi:hypothetical protein